MTTIREEPIDQDAALTSAQHNTRRQPLDERGSDPAQHSGEVTLAIEYVPPASLAGYHRNARRHSKRQIAQIAESIRAFGFVSPLLVDKAGEIIAGHGRLAAARQLGRATVPVVRIEHLDEAQKRALRLADNKLAELAGWDETLLALEFSDLLELDLTLDLSFDLAVTGFTSPEIDRLVDRGAASTSSSTRDDEVPARDAEQPPVSRLGDVWILGKHRIFCGDARDAGTYAKLLGAERATMGIHDSPYDVPISGHVAKPGRHREFVVGSGELGAAFVPFLTAFLAQAATYSHPGAIQFAFMDWRHMTEMLTAGREAGLALKNLCVWNKGSGAMGSFYRSQHELIFVFKEPNGPGLNNVQLGKFGRTRTNVWDYPGAASLRKELELHPTPKPVALVADAIRDASHRNDIVLDAFAGSGTTIIAAQKTGRRARLIELDPGYVDVAVQRWEQWSGETARHAETGLTFAAMSDARQSSSGSEIDEARLPKPVRTRQRPQAA